MNYIELVAVGIMVLASLVYLIKKLFAQKSSCGCSKCSCSDTSKNSKYNEQ